MSNYDANLMDWDSAIESDGQQFIVLDEGDYLFLKHNTRIPPNDFIRIEEQP